MDIDLDVLWPRLAELCRQYDIATLNLKDYKDFQTHHGLRMLGAE